MEYRDLFPNRTMNTINDYENMILEQKARLREKHDMTRADLVKKIIDLRIDNEGLEKLVTKLLRDDEAREKIISQLLEEIQELEDAFSELTDDYNTLEDQFIRIGGAEDPAMRG